MTGPKYYLMSHGSVWTVGLGFRECKINVSLQFESEIMILMAGFSHCVGGN